MFKQVVEFNSFGSKNVLRLLANVPAVFRLRPKAASRKLPLPLGEAMVSGATPDAFSHNCQTYDRQNGF